MVNTETLRNRLWVIDHCKYRYGANHTFWVHNVLGKTFRHLNKYKFNYGVKAFMLYATVAQYKNYYYVREMSLLSDYQRAAYWRQIELTTAGFVASCVLI